MAAQNDRRESERFAVNADTTCSFIAPLTESLGAARVKNISMQGIGLVLSKQVEPGARLVVGLSNPARTFAKIVIVRVVHVTSQLGSYLVGGEFETPL